MAELSKAAKLLIAAGRLAAKGETEFSAEDLTVQAHEEFPHDFSMKGHLRYPDSNAVFTQVMGKKAPLIVRGWLEKTGAKQYRHTAKGIDDLNHLELGEGGTVIVRVTRPIEDRLARLLTSTAYQLFKSGQQDQITFHQFCLFSGLSARDKWQKVRGKLENLEHLVREATKIGESGQSISIFVGNHNENFAPEELRKLGGLLRFLMERFKNEMGEWERKAST